MFGAGRSSACPLFCRDMQIPALINSLTVRIEGDVALVYNRTTAEVFETDRDSAEILSLLKEPLGPARILREYACTEAELERFAATLIQNFSSEELNPELTCSNLADFNARGIRFSAPLFIYWDFTRRCNLMCTHCFNEASAGGASPSFSELCRYIDDFANCGVFDVVLAGGEPFLYPKFPEFIEAIHDSGLTTSVVATNGTCLRDEVLERLSGKIGVLQISLDGPDAETHETIRGVKGCFRQTLDGIARAAHHGHKIRVAFTITRSNASSLGEFLRFCNDLPIDSIKLGAIMPIGRAGKTGHAPLPTGVYQQLQRQIDQVSDDLRFSVLGEFAFSFAHDDDSSARQKNRKECGAANEMVAVDYDGKVYPCSYAKTSDFLMGDLHDQSISEIYSARETAFDHPECLTPICQNCGYFAKECAGGCRLLALYVNGDFYARDPLCPLLCPGE